MTAAKAAPFLLLELMPLFFTTLTPSLPEILVVTTAAAADAAVL